MLTATAVPRSTAAGNDALPSCLPGRDRIVHLDDVEIALLDPFGEGLEIGQFIMGHAKVPDAAFLLLQACQQRQP